MPQGYNPTASSALSYLPTTYSPQTAVAYRPGTTNAGFYLQ
jgi:hypothetical protein